MAATAQISSILRCYSAVRNVCALNAPKSASAARFPRKFGSSFVAGSPLLIQRSFCQRTTACDSKSVSIRSEQNSEQGSGLDVWLGRLAMVGFAAAISVEIGTGKGLLENFGLITPLPTVALAVTGLVGVLTAIFIFQSASDN